MKYYEFVTGDTIEIAPGRTLKRIRAVAEIAARGNAAGQLGGYIEHEKNLFGDAWVSDNAWVYGSAQVYGSARVCGNAMIDENGLIFWASKVGSENGTLTVYNTKSNELEVTCGCFCGSVDEFLTASEAKHDDDTHLEYQLLIDVATSRITRARERLREV